MSRARWWYRVVALISVCPISVAAVSRGLEGWEPTWDTATTTVRIRDVLSAHPPLVGLAALPSAAAEQAYSFPGAMHLYLLAVPVRLLGTTWGLLLGMAAINTAMSLTAIWLVRRRLGEGWAMVGALFVASLLWTLGSGVLIFPTPIVMGVVPLFTFLVAAWSVADRDVPALVVFAFTANYLFVNQLVFIVIVPLVGFVALGLFGIASWRARREDPDRPPRERRNDRWWIAAAVGLTVLVWIPPLIDQFVGSGNLGKLVRAFATGEVASHDATGFTPTLGSAAGVSVSVLATPPAWLPPSFSVPPFGPTGATFGFVRGLLAGLVLVVLLAGGALAARRRGDRTVTAAVAVAVAVAGIAAYLITAWRNPDPVGYLQRYFFGLWSLSAFVWMVIVIAVVTAAPRLVARVTARPRLATGAVSVAVVIVVTLAIVRPPMTPLALAPSRSLPAAVDVRRAAADAGLAPGPVLVTAKATTRRYLPSVLLGLQDAGVPFRVEGAFDTEQFGASRGQAAHRDATTEVAVVLEEPHGAGWRRIAAVHRPPLLDPARYARFDAEMRRWADSLETTDPIVSAALDPATRVRYEELLAELYGGFRATDGTDASALFLAAIARWGGGLLVAYLDVPGMTQAQAVAWARERRHRDLPYIYLYERPLR